MPEFMKRFGLKLGHEPGHAFIIKMEFVVEFVHEFMPEMPILKGYPYE